jgi:cardiolipin synthase
VRPTRSGITGSLVYAALGVIWILGTGPPGSGWPLFAWVAAVAIAGAFIPGEANQVSLARAYLAAPALAYSVSGQLGLLAVAVAVAGLTDLVDGTIARRFERPSNLGGALDPVVDGVFLGSTTLGLSLGGAFPLWLAIVVIARYLLPVLGGGLLIVSGRRPELHHTLSGQVSTTLILILVGGVALFRGLNQDPDGYLMAAEVVIPVATVATFGHLAWASRRRVTHAGPG